MRIELIIEKHETQIRHAGSGRWAVVYPNAQNGGETFGLRVHVLGGRQGGEFLGADFSDAEARDIGLDFVTSGRVPARAYSKNK